MTTPQPHPGLAPPVERRTNQEDDSVSSTERRREAARWRVAAAWSVPLALVVGDTEDEMERAAASHRRDWCLPGLNRRR